MIVLYINSEHCTSLEQLKGYFSRHLMPESDIYADLLDYGRHGDITKWLSERGETELSSCVAAISTDLSDSAFYGKLKAAITGTANLDYTPLKPTFDKCFSFEDIKCNVKETEAKVRVSLKVLMCVNEEYELRLSCNWGMRALMVNPYNHSEGKTANFDFTFYKRPGKNLDEITVLADGKELSRSSKFSSGDNLITIGNVKFKMIHVEGGSFDLGSNCHVTLSNYSIGETPVTQELWQAVMGNNPSNFKGDLNPVECVTWIDCDKFIKKLNEKTKRKFRLPTEAEWEFAARGGTKSKGYEYSGWNNLDEVAWYDKNSNGMTHPVKKKKPNELGIYDMSGNVWEWCQDWYDDHYKSGSITNPKGPTSGADRVIRGGCWVNGADFCRPSCRGCLAPGHSNSGLGFRLALSE